MLNKRIVMLLLCAVCADPLLAETAATPIDAVRVVVNDDVITRLELAQRMQTVVQQLQKQGTQLPERGILEKQVLERMIMEKLQLQFAKENGVRVDDAQMESALQRIAQQNKFDSLAAFRSKLEKDGIDFARFREEIRGEILSVRLREREVDSKLFISDSDIEVYLDTQAKQGNRGEQLQLAHILIVVPEQATAENLRVLQRRAEEALQKLRGGAPGHGKES